jgi:hypothetical protein
MDAIAPEKKGSWHNPQHVSWPIHGFIPSFSPKPTNEAVGLGQASVETIRISRGPYITSMRSVCSILARGVNPLVLNQHRQGLQPYRCRLSTYHSLTFPTDSLHFPPKGPARSHVIKYQHKPLTSLRAKHLAAEWPPCHSISTEHTTTPSSMLTASGYY